MDTKNNGSNELKITRLYDAPVRAVWKAWVDPKEASNWWGPRGFTITTHAKDLRPGGFWKYVMHGPDGTNYDNVTVYHEVEEYKKLVYDHGGSEDRPPLFRVAVLFSESHGKTKMEMTMTLPTPEAAAEIAKFVKQAGGNATWDRLGEFLAKEEEGREVFIINRTFGASIDKLFEMWTNPDHLSQWLAPIGTDMTYFRTNIKEGGTSFYKMVGNGMELYGQIEYLKIDGPNQLVYLQRFCDKDEKPGKHPMIPVWPETMKTVVSFVSESPTSTRLTVMWEPQAPVSPEELDVFIGMRGNMTQGWTGSFDKLATYLGVVGW